MKKVLIYSIILFWWCLMFPSNSYLATYDDLSVNESVKSIMLHDKEIRFRLLEWL